MAIPGTMWLFGSTECVRLRLSLLSMCHFVHLAEPSSLCKQLPQTSSQIPMQTSQHRYIRLPCTWCTYLVSASPGPYVHVCSSDKVVMQQTTVQCDPHKHILWSSPVVDGLLNIVTLMKSVCCEYSIRSYCDSDVTSRVHSRLFLRQLDRSVRTRRH